MKNVVFLYYFWISTGTYISILELWNENNSKKFNKVNENYYFVGCYVLMLKLKLIFKRAIRLKFKIPEMKLIICGRARSLCGSWSYRIKPYALIKAMKYITHVYTSDEVSKESNSRTAGKWANKMNATYQQNCTLSCEFHYSMQAFYCFISYNTDWSVICSICNSYTVVKFSQ